MPIPSIIINGVRPACVSKRRAVDFLDGERKLVDRMLWSARNERRNPWLVIVRNRDGQPGQAVKIDTASLEHAYQRLLRGEEPPRLPSQRRSKANTLRDSTSENIPPPSKQRRRRRAQRPSAK